MKPGNNYLNYDRNGHLLELSSSDGIRQVFLWGYNSEYPVAKITGSDYNTVRGFIDSVDKLIDKAVSTLSNLDIIYSENTTRKREIISSIFPEKLSFDGFQYRTPPINEGARLIFQINNNLRTNKNRKEPNFLGLSGKVVPTRIELVSKV